MQRLVGLQWSVTTPSTGPDGYFYKVNVGATGLNPLNIDVYDPAMVYQGDTCGSNNPTAAEYATLQTQYGAANAARYQGGNDKWCTGDQDLNGANIKTTYIVRAPDNTPLNDTDNQPICAITFDAYNADVFSFLDTSVAANNAPRGTEKQVFSNHFHKDFTICQVPAGQLVTGDYIVQVRTNADLTSAPANPTVVANSVAVDRVVGERGQPRHRWSQPVRHARRLRYGRQPPGGRRTSSCPPAGDCRST